MSKETKEQEIESSYNLRTRIIFNYIALAVSLILFVMNSYFEPSRFILELLIVLLQLSLLITLLELKSKEEENEQRN